LTAIYSLLIVQCYSGVNVLLKHNHSTTS